MARQDKTKFQSASRMSLHSQTRSTRLVLNGPAGGNARERAGGASQGSPLRDHAFQSVSLVAKRRDDFGDDALCVEPGACIEFFRLVVIKKTVR